MATVGQHRHHGDVPRIRQTLACRSLQFRLVRLHPGLALRCDSGLGVCRGAPCGRSRRAARRTIGTLVLTLSMSGMEMMMIAAVMYTGHGESSLARDTMLAIVMIVLNGLVGVSMLTFARERTNVLLGAVHLLLFLAYLMLIFEN